MSLGKFFECYKNKLLCVVRKKLVNQLLTRLYYFPIVLTSDVKNNFYTYILLSKSKYLLFLDLKLLLLTKQIGTVRDH